MCVSITDPGMTLMHRDQTVWGLVATVVNGPRIKHYISGTPINVETNIIDTVTLEEYISDTFQNVPDPEKE